MHSLRAPQKLIKVPQVDNLLSYSSIEGSVTQGCWKFKKETPPCQTYWDFVSEKKRFDKYPSPKLRLALFRFQPVPVSGGSNTTKRSMIWQTNLEQPDCKDSPNLATPEPHTAQTNWTMSGALSLRLGEETGRTTPRFETRVIRRHLSYPSQERSA